MTNTQCKRFAGKVAVVTGAAQGIGKACALRLGKEGARIVIADKSETAAHNAKATFTDAGIEATVCAADLSKYSDACAVMDWAKSQYGGIDVLVNNVGGTIWKKPFWHYTEEEIKLEVNRSFWPTLWCCRAVIDHFRERGAGVIVNIGSNATMGIYRIPYSASKGGVAALTTALAIELADLNIRVNCISPGATKVEDRQTERLPHPLTPQEQVWSKQFYRYIDRENLFDRYATVDEQASVVAFLASDDASYLTGEVIDTGKRGIRISEIP